MNVNDSNLLRTPGQGSVNPSEVTKSTQVNRPTSNSITSDPDQDGDGVQLSTLSQALSSLQQTPQGISETGSPERDAQAEKLAQSYAQGSYQVDANATADSIIKSLAAGNGF
jgi:anti-sigma28 factor (negative regulator of flagellin synthesis)